MVTIIRESIWPIIQKHPWKWRYRRKVINGIIWHATRGNQGYDGWTEVRATKNWFLSTNNRFTNASGVTYAGISNYAVGPGYILEAIPPEYMPAFSSWPSDEHAISIEVAQSNYNQPIEKETIETCIILAEELSKRYGIPKVRNFSSSNDWTWTGHIGHANTLQGRYQGKTDPDNQFWDKFWLRFTINPVITNQEDYVTPQEFIQALKTNPNLRNEFVSLVKGELPIHFSLDEQAERKLVEVIFDSIDRIFSEELRRQFPDVGSASLVRWVGMVTRRLDAVHDAVNDYLRGVITERQLYERIEQALSFRNVNLPPVTT